MQAERDGNTVASIGKHELEYYYALLRGIFEVDENFKNETSERAEETEDEQIDVARVMQRVAENRLTEFWNVVSAVRKKHFAQSRLTAEQKENVARAQRRFVRKMIKLMRKRLLRKKRKSKRNDEIWLDYDEVLALARRTKMLRTSCVDKVRREVLNSRYFQRICHSCYTRVTPRWRSCGVRFRCNACYLRSRRR
jgi:hypothetical protein